MLCFVYAGICSFLYSVWGGLCCCCWSILPGALVEKYFVQHLIGNDFKRRLLGLRVFQQPRTHRAVGNNRIIVLSGVC